MAWWSAERTFKNQEASAFRFSEGQRTHEHSCRITLPSQKVPFPKENAKVSLFLYPNGRLRFEKAPIMGRQLEKLLEILKSRLLKIKKPYKKIDKSESMRIEIRSRKAQKMIAETLKVADSLGNKSYVF
ncbi:hypothetical protein MRB53_011473 [Persea americana]|uniref:Uncharacterized protein n=1 Tax=Persea americana TaxID=3435 RepID=A0ACC2LVS4_PERAE|nr:hypothetical protein MRB53_011473 [Persea americana]